jgi:hypothetical protein
VGVVVGPAAMCRAEVRTTLFLAAARVSRALTLAGQVPPARIGTI